jgi:hypothetical protein
MLALPLLAAGLQAQKFKDAVEYNDYIVNLQNNIGREIISFNEKMAEETTTRESLEPGYQQMLAVTRDAVEKVAAMPGWDGSTELRDASLALFSFYLSIFEQEYVEMLDIVYSDAATEADYARLDEIMKDISERESALDKRFGEAQSAFAKKYNFILEENELQDEIDGE